MADRSSLPDRGGVPGVSRARGVAVPAAIVAAFVLGGGFALGRLTAPAPPTVDGVATATTTSFNGVLTSVYPTGDGGCITPDAGQGLDTASDTHCGPVFVAPGFVPRAGVRVRATPFDLRDINDEALQGFLLGFG